MSALTLKNILKGEFNMKLYKCIKDLQLSEDDNQQDGFAVGVIQSAEDWGKTAVEWCDSDGWENPNQWLIENWDNEQDLIDAIQDCWDIVLVDTESKGEDLSQLPGLLSSYEFNKKSMQNFQRNLYEVEKKIRQIMHRNELKTYTSDFDYLVVELGRNSKLTIKDTRTNTEV